MGRQEGVERGPDGMSGERRAQHRVLPGRIEILVDDEPLDPRGLGHVAKREVVRQAVEALGRGRRQGKQVPGPHRCLKSSGIVIGRLQPFGADFADRVKQVLRIVHVPHGWRQRRRDRNGRDGGRRRGSLNGCGGRRRGLTLRGNQFDVSSRRYDQ